MKSILLISTLLMGSGAYADCTNAIYRGTLRYAEAANTDETHYAAQWCDDAVVEIRDRDIHEANPDFGNIVFDRQLTVKITVNCANQEIENQEYEYKVSGNSIWTAKRSDLNERWFWTESGRAFFGADQKVGAIAYTNYGEYTQTYLNLTAGRDGLHVSQHQVSESESKNHEISGYLKKEKVVTCK